MSTHIAHRNGGKAGAVVGVVAAIFAVSALLAGVLVLARPGEGASVTGLWWLALAGVPGLVASGFRRTALVLLVLLAPLGWQVLVVPAQSSTVLSAWLAENPSGWLRIEGTVREAGLAATPAVGALKTTSAQDAQALAPSKQVRVLLGAVQVWHGKQTVRLTELEVLLPANSA